MIKTRLQYKTSLEAQLDKGNTQLGKRQRVTYVQAGPKERLHNDIELHSYQLDSVIFI